MTRTAAAASGSQGALQGTVIIDLTRVFAGPLCTQLLADNGADVIKVEPPAGDETRCLGPPFDSAGNAAYYSALNRGKRGISLNLSVPQGRDVLERLLEGADVLVENFIPGTMERWGLGYEDHLASKFPRLIYCSISGFGADGPLGSLPGYDAVLQAMCGVMSVNGDSRSGPTRVGIPLVDHLAGYVAVSGVLMALLARVKSGRGQRVEATLFDTALSLLTPQAANWLASGKPPELLGSAHPNIAPYDKFTVADGEIFIGIVNDGQFRRFCRLIRHPTLDNDPRFESNSSRLVNRKALKVEIENALEGRSAVSLCESLMKAGVPAGVVNPVPEALSQAHARHRDVIVERDGYRGVRSPTRLYGTPGVPGCRPPTFSEHSVELLKELGYDGDEILDLQRSGAVPLSRVRSAIPSDHRAYQSAQSVDVDVGENK